MNKRLATLAAGVLSVPSLGGVAYAAEVLWVRLDGSGAVQRLAHHRSTQATAAASPQGVPAPDGRRVLFASDWGVAGGPVQTYVVSCP